MATALPQVCTISVSRLEDLVERTKDAPIEVKSEEQDLDGSIRVTGSRTEGFVVDFSDHRIASTSVYNLNQKGELTDQQKFIYGKGSDVLGVETGSLDNVYIHLRTGGGEIDDVKSSPESEENHYMGEPDYNLVDLIRLAN